MLHFAILGTGAIAAKMARCLPAVSDIVTPYAVAARDAARAGAFAREHGFARSFGSYEALLADPAVDLVYIATIHPLHARLIRAALEAGKHVLCEKPLTLNAAQAQPLFALAQSRGLLLMEAMWTRFLPAMRRAREYVAAGRVGTPLSLTVQMGRPLAHIPRIANLETAGGVLLDIGIYPLTVADMLLGPADAPPAGVCIKNENGVDMQDAVSLRHGTAVSALSFSGTKLAESRAILYGDAGRIEIPDFWQADSFTLYRPDAAPETVRMPLEALGYEHEVRAAAAAIAGGLSQCPGMPAETSLRILRQMDALRAAWSIRYPGE